VLPSYVYVLLGWASDFGTAWRARVISNAIASLTLIPSLVVCWRYLTTRPPVNPRRVIEFTALLLGLLLTTAAITNIDRSDAIGLSLALYGPAPLLLWATVRFGGTGLAFALLWTTLFTIYTALQGRGPLAGGTPADTVVGVQLLLTANAVPLMLMAGLLGQNRARHRALHDTQQRFALATTAGGIGIWELQATTSEIVVADNVHAILGYRPEEVGRHLDDWVKLIVDADREEVLTRLTSMTSGTSDSFEAEFRVAHKDGSIRWLTAKGGATETRDGVPVRILGTYADITERKESARALLEANDALVRTGRIAAMAAFSASIAHELSQPLTGIATNTSACLRWIDGTGPLPRLRLHNALDDVLNDCRRAAHIVERTHAMFSNRPTERRQVDLNLVLRDILDAVHARIRESGVRVKLRADRDLPAVLGDPVQMQQVVLNLVVNAIDAMRETVSQRRLLELRTRRSRRFAIVSVRDTGAGLQTDDRRRLFDPFFTTKTGGTGMGLTISRSIVASHGGSLWAASNVDRGMTFRFKVPIADSATPH
jgi:PAS domain S-box-containing protein